MEVKLRIIDISQTDSVGKLNGFLLLLILFVSFSALSASFVEPSEIWEYENIEPLGPIDYAFVDHYNRLVMALFRVGGVWADRQQAKVFMTWGQGPNQVIDVRGLCKYHKSIAIFELKNKIKLFSYKNGDYTEDGVIWVRKEVQPIRMRDGFCFNDTFYIAGYLENDKNAVNYLRILPEDKGRSPVDLVHDHHLERNRYYEIRNRMFEENGIVYFFRENNLILYCIDNQHRVKKVTLSWPSFYKPMPKEFYIYKKYAEGGLGDRQFVGDLRSWSTGYSSITGAAVVLERYLLVQVRTCEPGQKRFAFLLYDMFKKYSLDRVFFTNDIMLAERNDVLYCAKDGQPQLDVECDKLTLSIYRLSSTSE